MKKVHLKNAITKFQKIFKLAVISYIEWFLLLAKSYADDTKWCYRCLWEYIKRNYLCMPQSRYHYYRTLSLQEFYNIKIGLFLNNYHKTL